MKIHLTTAQWKRGNRGPRVLQKAAHAKAARLEKQWQQKSKTVSVPAPKESA